MDNLNEWANGYRSSLLFMEECAGCFALEERVFTDSWTGKELCASCLSEIIDEVTNSPASEGDNLIKLMIEHDLGDEDDELG